MTRTQLEELVVKLTADVTGFIKNFQQAQSQTVETTKHIEDATEKVKGFTDSITSFGQAALAGIAGLGIAHWFKEVFNLASGVEHQFIGLSAAIKSNTDDVDNTLEAYKRFAEGMFEVTGTSKRATLALLQMDEMQGLTAKRAMETARQAIALGAASGMDPQSLISRLNMAQTGSGVQMLRRVPGLRGMTDETQMVDKANRMMAIGMEVSKAQMQSAAGVVAKLSEELEEVKKQFGKILLDALKPGIELLTKVVQWFKDLDERTKLVILSLAGMTVGVVALVNGLRLLNAVMSVLFSGTGGLLAMMLPLAVAAALWAEHLGGVSKAWELVKEKAQQFWDWIKPVVLGVWDAIRIGALIAANAILSAWDSLRASFEPLKELLIAGWEEVEEVIAVVADELESMWDPLEVAATAYVATLSVIGLALYVAFQRPLETFMPLVMKVFSFLLRHTLTVLPDMVNAFRSAMQEIEEAVTSAGSTASSILARVGRGVVSVGEWFASLPAKIKNALSGIADLIPLLPPLIHQVAIDLRDLVSVLEAVARGFRWVHEKVDELWGSVKELWNVLEPQTWFRVVVILSGMAVAFTSIVKAGALLAAIVPILTWALSTMGLRVGALVAGFAVFGDKFLPLAAAFVAWLAWSGAKMSALVGVITILAARTDLVWKALASVKEFLSWVANSNEWIKSLADKISSFVRSIGAAIGPVMSAIGGFFTSLGQSAIIAFELMRITVTNTFGVIKEVVGGVFEALSEVVSNFEWNFQNTVIVIASAVGIIAAMATALLAWAVAAKIVTLATGLLTLMMLPNKIAMLGMGAMWIVLNTLLVFTGIKLLATTIAWVAYKVALLMVTLVKGAFTLATISSIVALTALLALLIVIAAVVIGVVVVAFVAASNAIMALVEALSAMTLFSGVIDTFSHWKGILGGLVTAIRVDMGVAWKYVQDAMHLAGEEVKAYWPHVWARIKEGFTLLFDLLTAKFKNSVMQMMDAIFSQDNVLLPKLDAEGLAILKKTENDVKAATDRIREYNSKPLELGGITTPGMEAANARVEANIANVKELEKLKAAAEEEADKAAKKHKEELDTATKLNNLAQQHNELKKAELILANSADAIYKIQAYRMAMQAAMEARAAQLRKDVLDQESGKGPAQLAYEAGKEAAKRGEDVSQAVAKASAKTDLEAVEVASQLARNAYTELQKARITAASMSDEDPRLNATLRTVGRLRKAYEDLELARYKALEKEAQSSASSATSDVEKKLREAEAKVATLNRQFYEAVVPAEEALDKVAITAARKKFWPLLDAAQAGSSKAFEEYRKSTSPAAQLGPIPPVSGQVPSQESDNVGWTKARVADNEDLFSGSKARPAQSDDADSAVSLILLRIEELLRGDSKKPTLDVRPVGLK